MSTKINISRAEKIEGMMLSAELQWLAEQATQANVIIEIGSWKGRSTRALADHTPGFVICVDPFTGVARNRSLKEAVEKGPDHIFGQFCTNLLDLLIEGKIRPMRMVSVVAAALLRGKYEEKVDFVFIDGDHHEEAVREDILLYRPLLRPGGLLSGHDYRWKEDVAKRGVMIAVDELVPERDLPVKGGSIWQYRMP